MSQFDGQNPKEFNNFSIDEIILSKESSYETGEYNEIQITDGLITTAEEEASTSDDSVSKTAAIGSSVGMFAGIGGIVICTIASISASLNFLSAQSVVGISQAQCFFEISNIDYDEVNIQLEDANGEIVQLAHLFPTDITNRYVAEFYDLSPNSIYYLQGLNDDGAEIQIGEDNSFKTLDIPHYDIAIDTSKYDKANGLYNLTFSIDNPSGYHIDALLVCENDETLNQHILSTDGVYQFTLPNVLSSYRLELYQEDFLVGQTTFSDYQGIEVIDEAIEIGISSFYMGLIYGEINLNSVDVSIVRNDNLEEIAGVEAAPDGYVLYVTCYELEANTDYTLKISDISRETFTYFSYPFKTISVPQYEITIDDSNFDIANGSYDLTFNIDNPNNYFIEAYLTCLNDQTLNEPSYFFGNTLDITLPTPYSEYRLDLTLEGYDVGSVDFSYYTPMQIVLNTLKIGSTTFETEVDLQDVPIENISAYIQSIDATGDEIELEVVPIENTSRVYLRAEGLMSNSSFSLEIRDSLRQTFVYLSHEFRTLA